MVLATLLAIRVQRAPGQMAQAQCAWHNTFGQMDMIQPFLYLFVDDRHEAEIYLKQSSQCRRTKIYCPFYCCCCRREMCGERFVCTISWKPGLTAVAGAIRSGQCSSSITPPSTSTTTTSAEPSTTDTSTTEISTTDTSAADTSTAGASTSPISEVGALPTDTTSAASNASFVNATANSSAEIGPTSSAEARN